MGKPFAVVALVVFAFCFSSVLGRSGIKNDMLRGYPKAPAVDKFYVEGKIYCDPCQFEFETRLSYPLPGIKVTLQCRKPDTGNVTFSLEGRTDANGFYSLPVEGDHQDEICAVKTEESHHKDCKEPMKNMDSDGIVLTKNNGDTSPKRFVNALGFMTLGINEECFKVSKELDLENLDN